MARSRVSTRSVQVKLSEVSKPQIRESQFSILSAKDPASPRANPDVLGWRIGASPLPDTDPSSLPHPPSRTPEDGFITVARSNSRRTSPSDNCRGTSTLSSNKRLPPLRAMDVNPAAQRLVAAAKRSEIYKPRSGSSYYKQSALPVDQRDPGLLAIESNRGAVFPKDKFRPGMLIRAAIHEQDFHGTAGASLVSLTDEHRSNTKFGPIYTKYRKLIVIASYQDHYVAMPVYTHNGNGLEHKADPDEFVSIRDHRSKQPFTALSSHPALVTEKINPGIDPYHPMAVVHLTYPISRKYDLPVVVEGRLMPSSLQDLLMLYTRYAPKVSLNL